MMCYEYLKQGVLRWSTDGSVIMKKMRGECLGEILKKRRPLQQGKTQSVSGFKTVILMRQFPLAGRTIIVVFSILFMRMTKRYDNTHKKITDKYSDVQWTVHMLAGLNSEVQNR